MPSDSLAAESARSGGAFSVNRGAEPGSGPSQRQYQQQQQTSGGGKVSAPGEGGSNAGSAGALESQASYGGPAPTYVNAQYMTYEGGPKGENLKEVESFEGGSRDGVEAALAAEPGSKMDPSREAELRLGIAGPEERTKEQRGESGQRTTYGVLDETSA